MHSIVEHADDAIRNFDDVHDHGQCARFYDLDDVPVPHKKERAAVTPFHTEQRCHRFTVSLFATSLRVQGFTSQPVMIVTRPDSELVQVRANFMGNKVYYHETNPIPRGYTVCVETGTLTISLDITDSMSSIFQYLTLTEGTFSLHNSPPPACKLLHFEMCDTFISHTYLQVLMEQCQLKHHRLPILRACPSNL